MRKSEAIGVALAVVVFISSVAVFFYAMGNGVSSSQVQSGEQIETPYTIREYNGNIAVFKGAAEVPEELYEVPVETLPEEDIKNLKNGIKVSDEKQLRRLIEDLTS